ncbi:kelch-like protein 10 isoform X1 [Ictalurus furcatus]|uniref:kelch-like protein 10 isoform X1 n=1 Tax=Ictalurus furcatus TaxID=66913 RepID=UPI002350AEA3|nr:kelch-like protein 10 isoform X1 [Ictalurus furcatus]
MVDMKVSVGTTQEPSWFWVPLDLHLWRTQRKRVPFHGRVFRPSLRSVDANRTDAHPKQCREHHRSEQPSVCAHSLQSVEAYNPHTNSWRMLASMFNPRRNFGVEVMDGRLYVVGGYKYYDEESDDWFNVQDMNIVRGAVSCCVISGLPNVTDYTIAYDDLL